MTRVFDVRWSLWRGRCYRIKPRAVGPFGFVLGTAFPIYHPTIPVAFLYCEVSYWPFQALPGPNYGARVSYHLRSEMGELYRHKRLIRAQSVGSLLSTIGPGVGGGCNGSLRY